MTRLIDVRCSNCRALHADLWLKITDPLPQCHICGGDTYRLYASSTPVSGTAGDDSIPGGILIKHGLCNPDGTPRRYDSKSEMAQEAARRGYHNHVEHVTNRESDKNAHTQRWI